MIERSPDVQEAEKENCTVVLKFPESKISETYIKLAKFIEGINE